MDHQWRASPGPIQGNICPRCSAPHFPFCSPSPSPIFPYDPMHMQTQPPVYPYTIVDPFHGPRYSETNPILNGAHFQPSSVTWDAGNANYIRGEHFAQGFDYGPAKATGTGSDYGVNDRSSKRLKMDGVHLASYVEAYRNPSMPLLSSDDARRLKLIHDHGGGINGLAPVEKEHNPSFHETSAGQASNSSKDYDLNSQVGHLHGQSGYLNALGGTNGASVKRFYSNTSQRPHYDPRTNTPPHTLGHPDHTKYGCDGAFTHLNDSSHYSIPQNGCRFFPPTEEISVQPPLPASLPLPIRLDTPRQWITQPRHSSSPTRMSSFVFPFDLSSSTPVHSSYPLVPEAYSLGLPNQHSSQQVHSSGGLFLQDSQRPQTSMFQHSEQGQSVLLKHSVSDKPKRIDALSLFKPPSRDTRPDHFVIILRGLPGSGKSYLARMLRDLEVELGGKAPRIHSMDDYFMTEVEKVEENETLKSSGRGKRPVVKKDLEYCYEPEMEEAYRSSMLKAFKKTLDEGAFTVIIVDDRNLRVADFAQFWATAKISGYEVYLLETSYKDPVGCTARNIHGFTRDDVVKMAEIWEEAPPLYLQLDATLLFHGDDSKESNIHEVDMDLDDEDLYRGSSELKERKLYNGTAKTLKEIGYDGSKDKKTWDAEADHPNEEIKDLRSSKWSGDLDVDDVEGSDKVKGKSTALSGLFQAYGKKGKAVRWGDQIPNTGFSIAAMKKANASSLIIGPGSGYDLESNPLRAEESNTSAQKSGDVKQHSVFQERLRAERESFKAVFDRRRQRLGGLDVEED